MWCIHVQTVNNQNQNPGIFSTVMSYIPGIPTWQSSGANTEDHKKTSEHSGASLHILCSMLSLVASLVSCYKLFMLRAVCQKYEAADHLLLWWSVKGLRILHKSNKHQPDSLLLARGTILICSNSEAQYRKHLRPVHQPQNTSGLRDTFVPSVQSTSIEVN